MVYEYKWKASLLNTLTKIINLLTIIGMVDLVGHGVIERVPQQRVVVSLARYGSLTVKKEINS